MLTLHVLMHVSFEGPGHIARWAQQRGHRLHITHLYQAEPLPSTNDFDMLIVMGGPMGAHDEALFPWMAAEKALIRAAIDHDKKVLGICLGAQLIADVMGAAVYPNPQKEIGWFEVSLTPQAAPLPLVNNFPTTFTTFHWHGDTFDIPRQAIHLMQSSHCLHQAFCFNNQVLALQFHFESTPESLQAMIEHCGDELIESATVQSASHMLTHSHLMTQNQHLLEKLLDAFTNIPTNELLLE